MEDDYTSLFYIANSLMTLQTLYGTIPKIFAKGEMSKVGTRLHWLKRDSRLIDSALTL